MQLVSRYKVTLLFIMLSMGVFLHLYTQQVIGDLRRESRRLVSTYANMYAKVAATDSPELYSFLFDEVIQQTNFPLINTDANKKPSWWKGIGIDPTDKSAETIASIQKMIRSMEKHSQPVAVLWEDQVLGYLYFGDSSLINKLQWLPYVQVGVVGLFLLIGFMGFTQMKHSEERIIWVGMAKETAHQLGTPISSLMGWVEVLETGSVRRIKEVYQDMNKDLQRLAMISQRFSQIGSKPDLKPEYLPNVLQDVAQYIRRRTPTLHKTVEIEEAYESVPSVLINADLFQWAIENLMKNSVDSMDKSAGAITICCFSSSGGRSVHVEIADNGRGMDSRLKKRIFRPGFSTKKRGWGLGLSLARRIIDEYHSGKLYVKTSRSGLGTTMRIDLNTNRKSK
ncbi:HAMP domain-containing histidine kinase [bacterium]|nr:HAMP domain-containing histidine kinase [bacterium]